MRICVCSDIHGNAAAFWTFVEDIQKKQIDLTIFCGDVFGYYYDADSILTWMRTQEGWKCLLGNHDKSFLEVVDGVQSENYLVERYGNSYLNIQDRIKRKNVDFLRQLKSDFFLEVDDLKLAFYHGGPLDPTNMRIYPDNKFDDVKLVGLIEKFDYVFCGHTHHKMLRKVGKTIVVNPGSIGQQRDGKGVSYIIFDSEKLKVEFHIFEYDKTGIVYQINEKESNEMIKKKLIEVLYRRK